MISWRDEEMTLMVTKQLNHFKIKKVHEKECKLGKYVIGRLKISK